MSNTKIGNEKAALAAAPGRPGDQLVLREADSPSPQETLHVGGAAVDAAAAALERKQNRGRRD